MYQSGGTISKVLKRIATNDLVLPAIQREFVWQPEQICQLFDSLMQGYPFGTFLFWKIEPSGSKDFRFYQFVRHYHQRDAPHCPPLDLMEERGLTAVLDGQQRLTALNIGLAGSMARKTKYKHWKDPNAFPKRHLCLNVLHEANGESDLQYEFDFRTEEQESSNDDGKCWFRVSKIRDFEKDVSEIGTWAMEHAGEQFKVANKALHRLYKVVFDEPLVTYYEEDSQDIERVLAIFIRLNSGGTVLSYSDLLLSIAVAQWQGDARQAIHDLVDELNTVGEGFDFSKDLVLKAGLMLADIGSVGFKVKNFNSENMAKLEKAWPSVREALLVAAGLLAEFGFNAKTVRADSALLPIAYYIKTRGLDGKYLTQAKFKADRDAIRQWFIRTVLKASGIWGSGQDVLLTALRETIREHGQNHFPFAEIRDVMARRGKSIDFEAEEINELAEMEYGDRRLFALLTLLFDFVNVGQHHFHIDHVYPKSRFTKSQLKKRGIEGEDAADLDRMANALPNLQLLEGTGNIEKQAMMPDEWIDEHHSKTEAINYRERHLLGNLPNDLSGFSDFYDTRRQQLRGKIAAMLSKGESDLNQS